MAAFPTAHADSYKHLNACANLIHQKQVTKFWQFFLLRMLTGIAVGGTVPLVYSLVGDLFPATQRSAMASMIQLALGAGVCGGQVCVWGGVCKEVGQAATCCLIPTSHRMHSQSHPHMHTPSDACGHAGPRHQLAGAVPAGGGALHCAGGTHPAHD